MTLRCHFCRQELGVTMAELREVKAMLCPHCETVIEAPRK